jgi:hypothetical protein
MFEAHGSFEIEVNGRILQANIKGGWNLESACAYKNAVETIVKPLIGEPWAMISIMDQWELYTPECKPIIRELCHNAYSNGLVREAMVNQFDSVKMQVFQSVVKGQVFQTKQEGMTWLNQQGFESS